MTLLTDDTKAVLLLCGYLGKGGDHKLLTVTEYARLADWLKSTGLRPSSLLEEENVRKAAAGAAFELPRLEGLMSRGVQLGFAIESWQQNGIWIISRSDNEYPARYRTHLGMKQSPPLLFGVGDPSLLTKGGLGVVGSRNVDSDGAQMAQEVGRLCAANSLPVVSGYARGVDQLAMEASLSAGGFSVGVLAENLFKKSVEKKSRQAIADGRLVLISHCHPNARFTVGNAMGRNKLIYALADYTLVVSSEYKKGGTWAGASEEFRRKQSRPVFVRMEGNVPNGNIQMIKELNAIKWPSDISPSNLHTTLQNAIKASVRKKTNNEPVDLLTLANEPDKVQTGGLSPVITKDNESSPSLNIGKDTPVSVYEAVLPIIQKNLGKPLKLELLAQQIDVNKTQLSLWLKRAVAEGLIVKTKNPVQYTTASKDSSA